LLLQAAAELDIDLSRSWMSGASDVDTEAGRAAGCRTILVENPRSMHRRQVEGDVDYRVRDVAHAAEIVVSETR
jgi:beta-phosphoglucomutase-like phosphatase (HAD superfamily)